MSPTNLLHSTPIAERAFEVTSLRSVPGLQPVSHRLTSVVLRPLLASRQGIEGVTAPRGLLLYGPPDPARRAFISALRGDLETSITALGGTPASAPTVVEVDAADAMATFAAFDAAAASEPDAAAPLVVVQTDEPWTIDPALLAAGRLDRLTFVAPPDWEARRWRIEVGAAARGLLVTQHLDELTAGTNGWTGADIAALLDVLRERTGTPGGPELLHAMATVRGSAVPWLEQARGLAAPGRSHVDDLRTFLERYRLV